MQPFRYVRAQQSAEAIAAFAPGTRFLAGGTNLIDLMKLEVERPATLVDVNALPLNRIEALPGGGLRVGALVRNSDLAADRHVKQAFPVLSQALESGASPQLRNMATVGGNLLQRTRCLYFTDRAAPCNKRQPGSGCGALEGCNRGNAVLGGSDQCVATHPSDMCVALAILDATIVVQSASGERRVAFADFHLLPGDHPESEHALQPGELITAIEIPAAPVQSAYLKVRDRASYAFALASAAVLLRVEAGTVKEARIALGGVATKPWRATEAERGLVGQPATVDSFRAAGERAMAGAKPLTHNGFKVTLGQRVVARALAFVAGSVSP